jgi:hypothetical protein
MWQNDNELLLRLLYDQSRAGAQSNAIACGGFFKGGS